MRLSLEIMDMNVNSMQKYNVENPTDTQLIAAWLHCVPKGRGILLNELLEAHSFFLYYFILEDMHTGVLQFVRFMIVFGRIIQGIISVVCRL